MSLLDIQEALQNTSNESDNDSDDDETGGKTVSTTTPMVAPTVVCSTCQEPFPVDEAGADPIYAVLCKNCFVKKHNDNLGEFIAVMHGYCDEINITLSYPLHSVVCVCADPNSAPKASPVSESVPPNPSETSGELLAARSKSASTDEGDGDTAGAMLRDCVFTCMYV
jgi:hypothetical protein